MKIRVEIDRLEQQVVEYERSEIETGKILFLGDSGFTRWKKERWGNVPLEEAILGKNGEKVIINHGFGTSTAEEQLFYYPRLVLPWKPKVLVAMTFGNDFGAGYNPEEILMLQKRMFEYARRQIPGIKIYVCDVRPYIKNIASGAWLNRVQEYNELLEAYCAKHEDCTLVRHITSPVFFENPEDVGDYKKVRQDIFVDDLVHFNQKGYELYTEFFRDVLDDVL